MPWFTSWVPSLPTINLTIPASIQGQFLSFLLRKCLGRFLKPGQLDNYQIDSQIGSGYVQVNQLELNPETINTYLDGLPVSLREGSVSAIKARIPWPNPLASTVGISLTSTHLIFDIVPPRNRPVKHDVDLVSVTSVADSFVHDELLPDEEIGRWHSLDLQTSQSFVEETSQHIPGALATSMISEGAPAKLYDDLAGVSLFASLIENLLARFEFDAQDLKISLVHANNMRLTLSLEEMRYNTDAKSGSLDTSSDSTGGERRTLSFSGLTLSATRLDGKQHQFTSTPTFSRGGHGEGRPRSSASCTSSSSSLDEETNLTMSQSLAFLPPRPNPSSDSVTTSMYQSALSMDSTIHNDSSAQEYESNPTSTPHPQLQSQEGTLLSFGFRPIIIQVTTPPPGNEDDCSKRTKPSHTEELQVAVSMNTVACAIRQWQFNGLLCLTQQVFASLDATSLSPSPTKPQLPPVKVTLCVQGVVLLLDHDKLPKDDGPAPLADFFERPLIPPKLNRSYTRIQLDTILGSIMLPTTSQGAKPFTSREMDLTVGDLSVLFFTRNVHHMDELTAFPLVVTDRYLTAQYSSQHVQPQSDSAHPILPTFDNVDWTQTKFLNLGNRLSHWRSRSSKPESIPLNPAFHLRSSRCMRSTKDVVEIRVVPLHIRLDLEHLIQTGGLLSFFDGLTFNLNFEEKTSAHSDDTVNGSPQMGQTQPLEELKSPFGEPEVSHKLGGFQSKPNGEECEPFHMQLTITFPGLRLSLRCPSPPDAPQRSGIVVIDIHGLIATMGSTTCQRSAPFAIQDCLTMQPGEISDDSVQWQFQFRRAVVASSVIGTKSTKTFASIGCLRDTEDELKRLAPLQPCVRVIKPNQALSEMSPIKVFSIDIPAIYADISKSHIVNLQYFADDMTHFFERMSENTPNVSRETSIIGSRFFARSHVGSLNSSLVETSESVVKLNVTEAFVRVNVPRRDDDFKCRPFDLKVLDLDVLLEINPIERRQTALTLGALGFSVFDTNKGGMKETLFSLTAPHSLTTLPQPIIKLRFSTSTALETQIKETRVELTLCGFTYTFLPDLNLMHDLIDVGKNPPGTFESVIPSDRTRVSVKVVDGTTRLFAPNHHGSLVTHLQEMEFSTDVVGDSHDSSFHIKASSLSLLALDDGEQTTTQSNHIAQGVAKWTTSGYALLLDLPDLDMFVVHHLNAAPEWKVDIHRISSRLHICADTLGTVGSLFSDFGTLGQSSDNECAGLPNHVSSVFTSSETEGSNLLSSVEDLTFKRVPDIGPAPDMINDDLPTNMYYLDNFFGAAAGLREIREDDVEDFNDGEISGDVNVVSRVGGETIKILDLNGLDIVEDYFLTIPPEADNRYSGLGDSKISVRVNDGNFNVLLYDGYDWSRTRKTIEEEVKEMRKRLAKIRQLVANGHVEDSSLDDTSALLFNSIHIGLDDDEGAFGESADLIAAIDEELRGDDIETTSWQSLPTFTTSKQPRVASIRIHGKRLTRSKGPSIEFCLQGLCTEFDKFNDDDPLVSRTFVTIRDLEILDHVKTSTWKKFLTPLKSDAKGNVRETESDMVRVEIKGVRPVAGHSSEEARMKAKVLPLRLYVDQDAVDFMKKFFSFEDPTAFPNSSSQEAYIQHAEIFPVDLKLDYKPRRVDYRALKQGRTIELMNFFHFDGAEMTLRHITLAGITGWGRLFEMLNDLWTPDVKATQLAEVISGVAPIRSVVNVGSGVADLILLPISQYKKDGRVVRGIQKGAKAFVKSTAIEIVKLGAKLATGTQVILEQAEGILGGDFEAPITVEPLQSDEDFVFENDEDLRSKYAEQPADVKEGVQDAYKSLKKNLSTAAQTILAVPMEVYDRSGNEGPVRSVIRAVPIAVLKPMVGASEAISKTLQGLHNTLDPNIRYENEAKYKR